jgi:hypothetical protein
MDNVRSNRRSDEQLEAILGETGHWVVNGQQEQALCFAASLRQAIERFGGIRDVRRGGGGNLRVTVRQHHRVSRSD